MSVLPWCENDSNFEHILEETPFSFLLCYLVISDRIWTTFAPEGSLNWTQGKWNLGAPKVHSGAQLWIKEYTIDMDGEIMYPVSQVIIFSALSSTTSSILSRCWNLVMRCSSYPIRRASLDLCLLLNCTFGYLVGLRVNDENIWLNSWAQMSLVMNEEYESWLRQMCIMVMILHNLWISPKIYWNRPVSNRSKITSSSLEQAWGNWST